MDLPSFFSVRKDNNNLLNCNIFLNHISHIRTLKYIQIIHHLSLITYHFQIFAIRYSLFAFFVVQIVFLALSISLFPGGPGMRST